MTFIPIENLGGGALPKWDGTLYDNGEEYTKQTGGFSIDGFGWGEFTLQAPTKSANSITTKCVSRGNVQGFATQKKIDLTNYTKLKCSITSGNVISGGYNYSFRLMDAKNHLYKTLGYGNKTSGIVEFDISAESGEYYILQYPDYTSVNASATINKVWLE